MIRLTLRSQLPGAVLARKVEVLDGDENEVRRHRRLVILIHGYQNSMEKATGSYKAFLENLKESAGASRAVRLGEPCSLYWPGDHRLGAVSLATYSVRVPEARSCGGLLARFISKLSVSQEVSLVAHSLGCRLALETVLQIREMTELGNYSGAQLKHVFLFAAAVPEYLCAGEYDYGQRTPTVAEHAFFSRHDFALGMSFNVGQHGYGERGRAVGRHGYPVDRWHTRKYTGLRHGEYWKSPDNASIVADRLGAMGQRRILGTGVETASDFESSSREVSASVLRERILGARSLPGAA